ncbi:MAG TPA: hypothetical protein VED46_16770 [Alphaproteobacteria bacterium]|nr:hypothetical protein [Alphaproteobacteria bacterium]
MAGEETRKIVKLEAALALRDHFLGWQCRIRQHAVRREGGRPSPGMRPRVMNGEGALLAQAITVLIVPRDPAEATYRFRHLARRTHDPAERFQKAIETLSEAYFQRPREFGDQMTGLFSPQSELASSLLHAPGCLLDFTQFSQSYRIPCAVMELSPNQPAWQHTYWHNFLFNPDLPPSPRILAFSPNWAASEADPPVS